MSIYIEREKYKNKAAHLPDFIQAREEAAADTSTSLHVGSVHLL